MTALILVLLAAGIIAGLIQFFVDYKGLPLYQPPANEGIANSEAKKSFSQKLYDFIKKHWQFFGYMVTGIAGAFLVPVIDQLVNLKGIREYLNCIDENPATKCVTSNWYLMVIMGYGIILGYASVRLIRSIGSFLFKSVAKQQVQQQQLLLNAHAQIAELKTRLAAITPPEQPIMPESLENATPNSDDDAGATSELEATAAITSCAENPNTRPWRIWRPALSLKTLMNSINILAPGRNKASDGMIGDLAHQSRSSDHNPWVWDNVAKKGVVTALDITHDPGKCDCQVLANSLQAGKDARIKYVIWNKRIMNSSSINGSDPWTWRPYTGANPHTKHIHISVKCNKEAYDETSPWNIHV
jgi:hypothetical protein